MSEHVAPDTSGGHERMADRIDATDPINGLVSNTHAQSYALHSTYTCLNPNGEQEWPLL